MAIVFSNNARTTLASNISNSATTITVADGSVFPSLTGGDIFYCTIDDGTNNEIVEVTAISSNTLTVTRGQDNTTARAFVSGDLVELRLVAKVLETFPQVDAGEVTADEFIGDLRGAVIFKAQAGEAVAKGDAVYVSGISGNTPVVALADADFTSKMPAFGLVLTTASLNGSTEVVTFGTISGVDTSAFSVGDTLYVSTTAGELTNSKPTGEASLLQNIGKVQRSHATSGAIKVGGAGRTNDTPNLNDGNIFIGNASNQTTTASLNTKIEDYLDANGTTFPDNVKAQFGTSNDLQIFHDGSNSLINEQGVGGLVVRASNYVDIQPSGGGAYMGRFLSSGAVELYHNGFKKFETTSGGVSVSGELDTTGNIAINKNNAKLTINNNTANTQSSIDIKNTGLYARYILDNDDLFRIFNQTSGFDTFAVKSNGDLYMGSTKWFDLSRNLTNIGTISSGVLSVNGGTTNVVATFQSTDGIAGIKLQDSGGNVELSASGSTFRVQPSGGTPVLEVDSSGNTDIAGTISSGAITSTGINNASAELIDLDNSTYLILKDPQGSVGIYIGGTGDVNNYYDSNSHFFRAKTGGTNRAVINVNGVDAKSGGFLINGTEVISSARNLTNIGTISSGAISTTSSVAVTGAASAGISEGLLIDWSTNLARFLTYDSSTGSEIAFYTQPSGGSTTQALRIDSSQNATFAGAVTLSSTAPLLYLANTTSGTGKTWRFSSASNGKLFITQEGVIDAVTLDHTSGNATFAGTISSGNITTTGYLRGPATFTIDPATHGDDTGTVVIAGNLQVDGTTTTINSTTLTVDDKNITLASGSTNAAAANGAGLTVDCGSDTDATFTYDGTNDEWDFNKNVNVTGTLTSGAITSSSTITASSNIKVSSGSNEVLLNADGAVEITRSAGNPYIDFKNSTSDDYDQRLQINSGNFNFSSPLQVSGTTFIDTSRNLTNIGTITNSGQISSSGKLVFTDKGDYIQFGSGGTDISWTAPVIFREQSHLALSDYSGVKLGGYNGTAYGPRVHVKGDGNLSILEAGLQIGSTTVIDSSRNLTNIGTISSGAITTSGTIINNQGSPTGSVIGGVRSYGTSSAYMGASDESGRTAFFGVDSSGYAMFGALTNHDTVLRANNSEKLRVKTNSNVQITSGALQMGATTVIDSSRNLTNIGTISSGAITSTGNSVFTGSGSSGTSNAFLIRRGSDNSGAFRVQNDGVVVTEANYLYAASSGVSLYVQNSLVARGSILNDTSGQPVRVADDFNVTGVYQANGTTVIDASRNLTNIGTIAAGKTVLTGAGSTNTYSSLLKTVNTSSDQWGHITLGGSATNSVTDNYYLIGRGSSVGAREMSFHIPNDGNYGDSTQPIFRFASSGSDTLMTITAETGAMYVKGTINSAGITATDSYGGGSGDFTNITTPPLKISAEGSYWRIPHISGHSTVSGVYNYESGKDVYWGESGDTGNYIFRGRSLVLSSTSTALSQGTLNALKIQTNSGRLDIGPMNSSFCHMDTDRPQFYFNKKIIVDEGIVASYDEDLALQRASVTKLNLGANNHNFYGAGTAMDVQFGSSTQTAYTNLVWNTDDGNAQLFKAGSTYTGWGGADAFNIYSSNGNLCFHPQGTANAFKVTPTTAEAISNIYADGGNLIMGDAAYSTSTDYVGMKTSFQSGSSDYMIISGLSDGDTYISAKNGGAVNIRGGGNYSSNQISVPDGSTITATTSDFRVTGNVTAYVSDKRLKTNIKTIENPIEKIKKIRGVEFDWIDNIENFNPKFEHETGVIAQEIEEVIPDAVSPAPFNEEYKTVDKEKIVALLIEAIKDQQKEIEYMKSEIKTLKENNNGN